MQHETNTGNEKKAEPLKKEDKRVEHNPFKDTGDTGELKESPEEEASAEQQRKETLTERD